MSETKFGTELGLMHRIVVNGRDVGADLEFWSILAGNTSLLAEVVIMAKKSVELREEDCRAVGKWLQSLEPDCPFQEEESYYANSSHSSYCDFFYQYHETLKSLFWKAQHNERVRTICEEIECYFVLCYTLSAAWTWANTPPSQEGKWFHHPSSGIFTTFHEVVENDKRAPRGKHLTLKHFLDNDAVIMVEVVRATYYSQYSDWCARPKDDNTPMPAEAIADILATCKKARNIQRARIVDMLRLV